jgi:N-methylhydantoinase B/oxoprolinase/acetone carboxylase alpha subunit
MIELIEKYGKDVFEQAIEKFFNDGEQLTLAGLRNIKKGIFKASEL